MDSIVRYCLPCSERSGRLVMRVAPALERERARRKEHRAAAPARAAESVARRALVECHDRLGHVVVVDLVEETRSCCEMLGRAPVDVTVKRTTKELYGESGRAWPYENRIHFTIGPESTAERLREIVLHEVLHMLDETMVRKARGRDSAHGPRFKRALFDAARQRWPQIRPMIDDLSRWERTGKAYDLDDAIVEALRATADHGQF